VQNGIDVTSLSLLHDDDSRAETILGLVVETGEVMATWQRLRAVADEAGFWPVCLNEDGFASDVLDSLGELRHHSAEAILAVSWTIDPVALLRERAADDRYRPRSNQEVAEEFDYVVNPRQWPDEGGIVTPRDSQLALYQCRSDPEPMTLALVPTRSSWELPAFFRWGNFNRCPSASEHVALLRRWHEQYGAEVVSLWRDSLEVWVHRLPRDRAEALELAWEHLAYCDDILDAGTIEELAKILMVSRVWSFWWD
jgi:hypothetical protein